MQNDFSFLPKLSLGMDIWEVSIEFAIWDTAQNVVSRSFALNEPKGLAGAGLEHGITALKTSCSTNCAMSECDYGVLSISILLSSLWKREVYHTHVWC
jgi:hypothetical protein